MAAAAAATTPQRAHVVPALPLREGDWTAAAALLNPSARNGKLDLSTLGIKTEEDHPLVLDVLDTTRDFFGDFTPPEEFWKDPVIWFSEFQQKWTNQVTTLNAKLYTEYTELPMLTANQLRVKPDDAEFVRLLREGRITVIRYELLRQYGSHAKDLQQAETVRYKRRWFVVFEVN
jgi:hypothetical protein